MLGYKLKIMSTLKNQVQLIGNLGKDIELKTFDNGLILAKATIATTEYFKNNKGEKTQDTQWHNVVAWGKTAEYMGQVLKKGDEVAIKGKLVYKNYQNAEGKTQYITEIVTNEFMKMGPKAKA
jgi:single-strand DNA-binding protein